MVDKFYNPMGAYPRPEPLSPGQKASFSPAPPAPMTHMRIEITRGQRGEFGYEISVSVDRPMDYPDAQQGAQWIVEDLALFTRFAGEIAQHELRYHQGELNLPTWEYPRQSDQWAAIGAAIDQAVEAPDFGGAPEPEEPTGEIQYDDFGSIN